MILYNYDRKRMTPFWEYDLTMYNLKPCYIYGCWYPRRVRSLPFTLHCSHHNLFSHPNRAKSFHFSRSMSWVPCKCWTGDTVRCSRETLDGFMSNYIMPGKTLLPMTCWPLLLQCACLYQGWTLIGTSACPEHSQDQATRLDSRPSQGFGHLTSTN